MLSLELLRKLESEQLEELERLWDEIGKLESCPGCKKTMYCMTRIIKTTIEDNGFQSFIIVGGKGNGKSTYSIKSVAMYYMYVHGYTCGEAYQEALRKIVFSAKDLLQKINEGHEIIIWDDAGLHASTYLWYDREMRQYIIALSDWYDVARTDINVLIITTPTKRKLPPIIRNDPDSILVSVVKHSKKRVGNRVYKYSEARGVRNIESIYEDKVLRTEIFRDIFAVYLPDPVYQLYSIIRKLYSEYARQKLMHIIEKIKSEQEEEYMYISQGETNTFQEDYIIREDKKYLISKKL